jgi:hypothetical protein
MLFATACRNSAKTMKVQAMAEKNKDVIVLSYLIRDHLRKTHNTNFTIEDILKKDTLRRISGNFSALKVGSWSNPLIGGISVYYRFSNKRNADSIQLNTDELLPWKLKEKKLIGKNAAELSGKFDGEIRFNYPERHYFLNKIVFRKRQDSSSE